jgi:hypothetical protein
MADTVPENKAQRAERLKREKNPWEGLGEIRRFSQQGFASIPPEWLTRTKPLARRTLPRGEPGKFRND